MTGIETMKEELRRIQKEEEKCVNEYGVVKTWMRNKYKELVEEAREVKTCIEILTSIIEKPE